jgi:hypothetical protein
MHLWCTWPAVDLFYYKPNFEQKKTWNDILVKFLKVTQTLVKNLFLIN